jgi:hypothetical protein
MDRHISPVRVYSVWPWMRDHARPTTPYAREQLEKCRTYEAPSKAHIKRIKRDRPMVLRARKTVPCDAAPRLLHNDLMAIARETRAILKREEYRNA